MSQAYNASSSGGFVAGDESGNEINGSEFADQRDGAVGADSDILFGGDGNDLLNGGFDTGLDVPNGGAGADTFVFEASDSTTIITNFNAFEADTMLMLGMTPDDVANRTTVDLGGGSAVVVGVGVNGSVMFEGLSAADIADSWFTFG